MPDVLLVQPPIRDFYLTRKRTIPYGLAAIAAELLRQNISVALLDALATKKSRTTALPDEMRHLDNYYGTPDLSPFGLFFGYKHFGYVFSHVGERVKAINPKIVGISSLFTAYSDDAMEVAKVIKKHLPNTPIIMGGHHPTAFPEAVITNECVDYVIRGEGEVAMPLLVKKLLSKDKKMLHLTPGLVYQDIKGEIRVTEPAAMEDLNQYPPPSFHLINHKYYQRGKKDTVTITASRGCPMACGYCSVGGASYLKYRRKTPETILNEIESFGPRETIGFIDFEDEHLSRDHNWFTALLNLITAYFKDQESIELRAMNGLFPPSLDENLIRKMVSAGFKTLNLSIGSTDPAQVKRFLRPNVKAASEKVLQIAETLNIDAVGYIIAGAPFQRPESSIEDLIWFSQRRVLAGVSIYYPAPLSKDFESLESLKLLPKTFSLMRNTALPISHTTNTIQAVTLLRLGRVLNFIKSLIDVNEQLPSPSPPKASMDINQDRQTIGRTLLSYFLHDGKIRGVRPDGTIYHHKTSTALSKHFLERLRNIQIRGCRSKRSVFIL